MQYGDLGFFRTFFRIYRKDTRLEWKSPVGIFSVFLFALILAAIYNYAMEVRVFSNLGNLHGIMLATLFYSSTLMSSRNIQFEKEGGALRVMLISPADPAGYFLGKTAALWQLQTIFILIYLPVYYLLLQGNLPRDPFLMVPPLAFLILAALNLSALGIMLSYIASGNRLKEIILPLILLPTSLPVFMLAADGIREAAAKNFFPWTHFLILLAPAALFCSLGCMLYHVLTADE